MSSFGWKRKANKLNAATIKAFTEDEADAEDVVDDDAMFEWIEAAKRRRLVLLEDCRTKSDRLKQEGMFLAENRRYWEAVKRWDEALQLTPTSAVLCEMKSQVLQELQEVFPAVESALKATQYQPNWSAAWQTLGRAQLGLGEVYLAQKSFERCLHLDPSNREVWEEDLKWAQHLVSEKHKLKQSVTDNEPHSSEAEEITGAEDPKKVRAR